MSHTEENLPGYMCHTVMNVKLNAVCVCVVCGVWCVCVCVSLTNDSSETIKVIIIKFGKVTASDMKMHHVLIILTVTFIQGHTDDAKCLVISENFQTMPITFAVTVVRLKVYIICS